MPEIANYVTTEKCLQELKLFDAMIVSEGLVPESHANEIDKKFKINTDWLKISLSDVEEFFKQLKTVSSRAPSIFELMQSLWKINIIGYAMLLYFKKALIHEI